VSLTLTARASALLADLPPYEANEPLVQRGYQAMANELDRMDAVREAIRAGLTPTTANDTYLGLSMLETTMKLPVAPVGVSVAARRSTLLAYLSARRSGKGSAWKALLTLALGNTPWTYFEGPGDYQITIKIGYASGSFTAGQVLILARAITPAHIDIVAAFDQGFLIGISQIGIEPL
jgi:hypothetical protein